MDAGPLHASFKSSAIQVISAEEKQDAGATREKIGGAKLTPGPEWKWQDGVYLFILLLLVIGMAGYFTPDFASEVPGMWWDPLLNMWTLSWDTTTLLHAPTHLWQAQILYPNNLTLSYSENLLGEAIFFAPFFLISHNPVLSYNVTFYITFLLCGTNMYITARHYTGKRLAAFVGALVYAFAPYRLGQIDHIHVVAGEWIPLAFLYLDLSFQQGRWRHWSLFALFFMLQLLSSIYYGIFLSYTLLTYILFRYTWPFLTRLWQDKLAYLRYLLRRAGKPIVVLGIMLIVLVLLMAPYLTSLHSGLERTVNQTSSFSASIRDFDFAYPFNWLHGTFIYNGVLLPYDSEHYLFLGWTTMALAALGIVLAFWRRNATMCAIVWTGIVVLLFSFGPYLQFSGPQGAPIIPTGTQTPQPFPPELPMPWLWAYYHLPGFQGLRVPARLIGVFLMMLALLAAYAVAWLQGFMHKKAKERKDERERTYTKAPQLSFALSGIYKRGFAVQCLLVLISLGLILEALPVNIPVTVAPTGKHIPAVYQWLATHGGQQPIVELPMSLTDGKDEAWYDYYAIYHSHPIANGWSGYRPPLTAQIAASLFTFPSPGSLATLRKYHIYYVVLHLQRYSPGVAATLLAQVEASPGLSRVAVFGSDSVWQVK
jgi:type II secretory pathway pseudopilin PulG